MLLAGDVDVCPVCAWLIKEVKIIKLHESACKKGSKEFVEELTKEPLLINEHYQFF